MGLLVPQSDRRYDEPSAPGTQRQDPIWAVSVPRTRPRRSNSFWETLSRW